MADQDCGICLQTISKDFLVKSECCKQHMCRDCATSARAYKTKPTCPFCRAEDYSICALEDGEEPPLSPSSLQGVWDVCITESSSLGKSSHTITLKIDQDSAKYAAPDDDESHYNHGAWDDLTVGHTPSGKTFVGKQKLGRAPSWLGRACVVGAGLRGRLHTPNAAKFTTSMTVISPEGDELEIVQEGVMKLRLATL
jgi:hypothetical protein